MEIIASSFLGFLFIVFPELIHGEYVLKTDQLARTAAKESCEAEGKQLYEQSELGQWSDLSNGVSLPESSSFWIGLKWSSDTEDFRWADNSPITTQAYWSDGQPNNSTGYTCVLQSTEDGKWSTAMCTETHIYVCEAGPATNGPYYTPHPRPQRERDNYAVMVEGLLKGFACAGGLILLVTLVMHLPCCKNWVKRKEDEVNSWQEHMHKHRMRQEGIQEVRTVDQY